MFKKLALLFLYSIFLYGNAEDLLRVFKKGDYKTSFNIANKICKISCNDLGLNLILGKSAYELGLFDEALSAYDRVLIQDENNIEARLQSALIYQKSGNTTLLKVELESLIRDNRLSEQDRLTVAKMLKNLKKKEKSDRGDGFYASLSIGYGYDTNPKKENFKHTSIYVPGVGDFLIPASKKNPSSNGTVGLNAGYKNHINNFYDVNFNFSSFGKRFMKPKKEDFSNLAVVSASFANGFTISEAFKINATLMYDYINLKEQSYLSVYTADIYADFKTSENTSLEIGYSYTYNDYIKRDDKVNNSNHFSAYINPKIYFSRAMMYLRASYDIEKNIKDKHSTANYHEYSLTTGFFFIINRYLLFKTNFNYTKTHYTKPIFKVNIKDEILKKINTGFDININSHNTISINFTYEDLKSTIDMNSYKNYSSSIVYRFSF